MNIVKVVGVGKNLIEWCLVDAVDQMGRSFQKVVPYRDGRELLGWSPQPGSQEAFLGCNTFEILLSGDRGGGKTQVLLADFVQDVGKGYGAAWTGILFRRTYPELADVIAKAQEVLPTLGDRAPKFVETPLPTWTWPTGEKLLFRHAKDKDDYRKYLGHEYPWIAWEELVTWPDEECYLAMMACCRSSKHPTIPRKVRSTTNPYGPGFAWIKERFNLPLAHGTRVGPLIVDPDIGNRRVIFSRLDENLVFRQADPDYKKRIKASASNAAQAAAWLEGSWSIVAGGMFDEVWRRVHACATVPNFTPPPSWRIDRAFDWGESKPFSVGWYAESDGTDLLFPDGQVMHTVPGDLFRFAEWYGWTGKANHGLRMLATDIARGIVERDIAMGIVGRPRTGIADASIFDENNGNCIARDMSAPVKIDDGSFRGVYFDPADKRSGSRKQGWQQMLKRLNATVPSRPGYPREEPGLFISAGCSHFFRTIPTLARDPDDPDDVDTRMEDHVADEVRYRVRKEHRLLTQGKTSGTY